MHNIEILDDVKCCCGHGYQVHNRAWAECFECDCVIAHSSSSWFEQSVHEVKV